MWTSEVFEEMPMVKNDIPRCYLNLLHPTDLLLTQVRFLKLTLHNAPNDFLTYHKVLSFNSESEGNDSMMVEDVSHLQCSIPVMQ